MDPKRAKVCIENCNHRYKIFLTKKQNLKRSATTNKKEELDTEIPRCYHISEWCSWTRYWKLWRVGDETILVPFSLLKRKETEIPRENNQQGKNNRRNLEVQRKMLKYSISKIINENTIYSLIGGKIGNVCWKIWTHRS